MTAATRTTLASIAGPVLAAAERANIRLDDLSLPAPLLRRDGAPPNERIPHDTLLELWRVAGDRSKNPTFGLHVAEHFVAASSYGVVGFLARHSATAGEALANFSHYSAFLKEEQFVHVEATDSECVILGNVPRRSPGWSHYCAEGAIASYVTLLRRWSGLPRVAPRLVDFQHAAPADVAIYERFFGCPVRFSQPVERLVWPAHVTDMPLATHDPELRAFFQTQAEAALGGLPALDDTRERLRRALADALPRGVPTLADAARALAMSARTLQRRLAEQGLSYHDVLDEARRDAALRTLAARKRALREAAEAAGFRDEKAFRRAFRRWTGQPPSAYRLAPA